MLTFIAVVHVLIALVLIVLVLLQDSKGGAMGGLGGGAGSSSVFGSTGAAPFLVKATRVTAFLFAINCVILSCTSTKREGSVLDAPGTAAAPSTEVIDPSKAVEGISAEPSTEKPAEAAPSSETPPAQ